MHESSNCVQIQQTEANVPDKQGFFENVFKLLDVIRASSPKLVATESNTIPWLTLKKDNDNVQKRGF